MLHRDVRSPHDSRIETSRSEIWATAAIPSGRMRTLCSGWDAFGPPDQGFGRLTKLIEQIKPTVVFVAYGMNESFDGPSGVDHFRKGLDRMLGMLEKTGRGSCWYRRSGMRTLVRRSRTRRHIIGTSNCTAMSLGVRRVGAADYFRSVSLDGRFGDCCCKSTFDYRWIHLTPHGYRVVADDIERQLGRPMRTCAVKINVVNGDCGATGIAIKNMATKPDEIRFTGTLEMLFPLHPILQVSKLPPGEYSLKIDGQEVDRANAEKWGEGVEISGGPDERQAEALRQLIIAKNFDFFNYWRPENDTYIFGYRKHEQGRNAVEVPRFEELIPAKEAEIAKLRVPGSHEYVLVKTKRS